ncbi:MAG TPA: DNA polymerase III subunit gamma/tau [Bacteroidales bacterium]|nr:DNA polymerase III subunit gamma/tau [Bacteroidales bacterium]HSA43994.1 DNA polymerase III subunit gamma/tau [Bacteroidales bacterium]
MEPYLVSARKYRPATFETVIGQAAITTTLKNAIRQNQLAQAFLFCGPRGVGKTTCARILAKTINCRNITAEVEPCNACESCLTFNTNASFNIFELDAASNNSVDDIRSLIEQVRIPPQAGKYKVYIIDEVHMLSQAAFNAFLKTLEEPPPYAKFILATTEKHKVLPTILSRCQVFDFRRISIDNITKQLKYVAEHQEVETEDDALHIIAQKSDGSMRDALSIFDQIVSFSGRKVTYAMVIENLNVLDHDYYFRLTDMILQSDYGAALLLLSDIYERGFEGQHFLNGFSTHLRNLLVGQDAATLRLLEVSETVRGKYQAQAARCQPQFLMKSLEISNQFDLNYRISNNKRLHLEILLLQLCMVVKQAEKGASARKSPEMVVSIDADVAKAPVKTPGKVLKAGNGPSGLGSLSIKALEHDLKTEKKEQAVEADPFEGLSEPFGPAELEASWKQYAEGFRNDQPSLFSTLLKRKPVLSDDCQLTFTVDSRHQEEQLTARKTEMVHYLRKSLRNGKIGLQIQLTSESRDDKPYTAVDKYRKMVSNNPSLQYLKDQLDLDLEY